MTRTRSLLTVVITIAAATLLFWIVLHEFSSVWLDMALRPDVRRALEQSMEDQKALRSHDPVHRAEYRKRFDETQKLMNRIEVLRMNRAAMLRRFEFALLIIFALVTAAAVVMSWMRYRRAQEHERSDYLERVTSLQETARRHAHEIKGPLTAARLELERYADLVRAGASDEEIARMQESVSEELERLARYTREFSSFAGIGKPVLRRESLGEMLEEFCTTFANAWPETQLQDGGGDAVVCVDRDMFRQVLVNLCSNSARAGAGSVRFLIVRNGPHVTLEVRDNGSGIAESLRARVFDPYVTTRRIGEGMGLGLSISRKVMLDHGGDLVLASTSASGTTFRVIFGECA
ncbi:MAG TPA: HAMP domain-containing sensor histidine kinase [Thermoanaerobaculia bacterium]|nr:HAMP domain-containing sensor histidine kinase [Thermoanaerobaculia bacterium]